MGLFGSILNLTPKAQKLKKAARKYERRQAGIRIENAQRAIEFRKKEDPREQAMLKQSVFGRGLGKSTIHDQARDRLDMIQRHRREAQESELGQAIRYRKIIKAKAKYDRRSQWIDLLDGILSIALGAGTGGGSNIGIAQGQASAQQGADYAWNAGGQVGGMFNY